MSTLSNCTILGKADQVLNDLTTSSGLLKSAQVRGFMRLLIEEGVLLKLATVVPMILPKQQISETDLSQVELDAKLFKAEVRLSDKMLEHSIERGELHQTIMEMLAKIIGRDMEEVIIQGDTTSTNTFLAMLDGLLKQATSNVVDAAGANLSENILTDMLKTLPSEHLRGKEAMCYLTSIDAKLDYRASLAERIAVVGDEYFWEDTPVVCSGVPIKTVPLFPKNLGTSQDQTCVLLCNPKNIHVGIWQQIRIESVREISRNELRIVVTIGFDAKYADESGVAKATAVGSG